MTKNAVSEENDLGAVRPNKPVAGPQRRKGRICAVVLLQRVHCPAPTLLSLPWPLSLLVAFSDR